MISSWSVVWCQLTLQRPATTLHAFSAGSPAHRLPEQVRCYFGQWRARAAGQGSLPVGLQGVVVPVVGQGDDQLEASLASLCDDNVQPLEGLFVVHSWLELQVEALLDREPEYPCHAKVLPHCSRAFNILLLLRVKALTGNS